MMDSWIGWKDKDMTTALKFAQLIGDRAWRRACIEWLERKVK